MCIDVIAHTIKRASEYIAVGTECVIPSQLKMRGVVLERACE